MKKIVAYVILGPFMGAGFVLFIVGFFVLGALVSLLEEMDA